MAETWESYVRKAMYTGEHLVWKATVHKLPDLSHVDVTGWIKEEVYFTSERILWHPSATVPTDIPYNTIGKIEVGPPGSGGVAGVRATAGRGGTIDVSSSLRDMSFQFINAETLKYAEWIIRQGMSGTELKPSEGIPEIRGERDPNAPPPTPKKGGCFIATAATAPDAPEVALLSDFRDAFLLPRPLGRRIVYIYYQLSPTVAQAIQRGVFRRRIVVALFVRPAVAVARWLLRRTA